MSAPKHQVAIIPDDGDFAAWLARARESGIERVEIGGLMDRPDAHREALADSGLFVFAVRLGVGFGSEEVEVRRAVLERQKRMVIDAAQLGATLAILTPPREMSDVARACFEEGRELLAAFAAGRGLHVEIEGVRSSYERVSLSSDGAL